MDFEVEVEVVATDFILLDFIDSSFKEILGIGEEG